MLLPVVMTFLGVFLVTILLASAWGMFKSSRQVKQTSVALEMAVGSDRVLKQAPITSFKKTQEKISAIPWMNAILAKTNIVPRLQRLLKEADLKWTVGALVLMSLACFGFSAYIVYWRVQTLIIAIPAGLAIACLPFAYVLFKRQMRINKFEQGLPTALDLMVSALRVGHSFTAAMALVTRECPDPVSSEFKTCYDEQNYGLDMRTALEHLVERVPLQDLKIVVTAILIQRESGGNLAELLEKAGVVLRERFRLRRQVMTHTAQGRMTGWILTMMPPFLGFALYLINPTDESLLWTTPIGVKLLIAAGCSLLLGTLWIQKIIRIDI